jgi:hypothetical protein
MKQFIEVSAQQANEKGQPLTTVEPQKMLLNINLISAILGTQIKLLNGAVAIALGENYFTNFKLLEDKSIFS